MLWQSTYASQSLLQDEENPGCDSLASLATFLLQFFLADRLTWAILLVLDGQYGRKETGKWWEVRDGKGKREVHSSALPSLLVW